MAFGSALPTRLLRVAGSSGRPLACGRALRRPVPQNRRRVTDELRSLHRVADDDLVGYPIYLGTDGPPDFAAAPFEVATGLPHETAALAAGHTYQIVVRGRNAYGVESQNLEETVLEVAGDGSLVAERPSAPFSVALAAGAGGTALLTALYNYLADEGHEGTTWLLYLRSDGTEPDPSVDTPAEAAMAKADGIAKLGCSTAAFGHGTTIKALVRTRYVSGVTDVDSASSAVVTATADTSAPDAPAADAFLGLAYRQNP